MRSVARLRRPTSPSAAGGGFSLAGLYCSLILLFLYAPIIVIAVFSFEGSGRGTLPINSLSTRWYREVFASSALRDAFVASAVVALVSTVITVLIGTLAAFALWRRRSRLSPLIVVLAVAPVAMPPLVLGVSLLSFFDLIAMPLSLRTVIIGHALLSMPFVLLTVAARLSTFDASLLEAARDLGATPWQVLWRVTYPLVRVSLFGAALLALALSASEFVVTLFTIGGQDTVPVSVWGQMRRGVSPSVNAISTLLLLATLVVVVVTQRLTGAGLAPVGDTED